MRKRILQLIQRNKYILNQIEIYKHEINMNKRQINLLNTFKKSQYKVHHPIRESIYWLRILPNDDDPFLL